jgi:hypothetical protein
MSPRKPSRTTAIAVFAGIAGIGALTLASRLRGSDHQDTPDVELSSALDINDVYVFPGSTDDRVVFMVTTHSPLTPAQTAAARFDPNALYQIKIDNTGDAVEDLVIQLQFDDTSDGSQTVNVIGPIKPTTTGMLNRMASATPTLTGSFNTTFGSATGMQVFTGPRDDPFYIDLEQFFRILPDRRPSRGALSTITQSASAFRAPTATAQPPFAPGPAVDFLRGINSLAIVVEVPKTSVRGTSANGTIGVWATVSR